MRNKRSQWVIIALTLAVFACFGLQTAANKSFWLDEAWIHAVSCKDSIWGMLAHGANDCSPSPLYHVLQKTLFQFLDPLGNIRIGFRLVTLLSSLGLVATLFLFLGSRLGNAAALFAMYLLLSQPLFFQYAAEERAYMFWTALMTATWVGAVVLLEKLRFGVPRRMLFGFSCLAFLLMLVTTPGFIQAVTAVVSISVFAMILYPEHRKIYRHWIAWPLGLFAIFSLISLPYFKANCGGVPSGPLVLNLKDPTTYHLLSGVLRLLVPKESALASIWSIWVILGIGLAIWSLVRSKSIKNLEIAWLAVAFLASYGAIAGALYVKQYFFVQRIFLGLVVLRAIFGAIGMSVSLGWLAQRFPRMAPSLPRAASLGLGILFVSKSFWVEQRFSEVYQTSTPPGPTTEECCLFRQVQSVYVPKVFDMHDKTNFLWELGSFKRSCESIRCANLPAPQNLITTSSGNTSQFRWKTSAIEAALPTELVRFSTSGDFCLKEMKF